MPQNLPPNLIFRSFVETHKKIRFFVNLFVCHTRRRRRRRRLSLHKQKAPTQLSSSSSQSFDNETLRQTDRQTSAAAPSSAQFRIDRRQSVRHYCAPRPPSARANGPTFSRILSCAAIDILERLWLRCAEYLALQSVTFSFWGPLPK